MKKWIGKEFESSSSKTLQFTNFARDFKKAIKKQLIGIGAELVKYNINHFEVSGFIKLKNNQLIYFNTLDVRYSQDSWFNSLLCRTAKDLKDYTGGRNYYIKYCKRRVPGIR